MDSLRICTFNVRYDTQADEPYHWEARRETAIETIRDIRPDILCLQEPLFSQLVDIEAGLVEYDWWGQGRRGGNDGEFAPIGWRSERLTLLDGAIRWLSPSPSNPETVGWDASLPRIVTGARVVDDTGELSIWNTHFSHKGNTARLESSQLLTTWLETDSRTVLAGDFNCEPGSDPYRHLTTAFEDSRAIAGETHGPTGTFSRFTGSADETIDHVFVSSDVTVDRYEVVDTLDLEPPPSDHLPVVVDVQL